MPSRATTVPLLPRRRLAGRPLGSMRSRRRGLGVDLAGSRLYRRGDDVRAIDHRATARRSSVVGTDEIVVREFLTEESTQVVIVVDRRPSMSLFGVDTPWLSKPAAVARSTGLLLRSALDARCIAAVVEHVGSAPRTRPAQEVELDAAGAVAAWGRFDAPARALDASIEQLLRRDRPLPSGSFVFILSDFLDPPPPAVWDALLSRGLDVVPVVLQDPVWERSFPEVAGAPLALTDPAATRGITVRLHGEEVQERRRENERRLASRFEQLDELGLDYVDVARDDAASVLVAFQLWAESRRDGARLVR